MSEFSQHFKNSIVLPSPLFDSRHNLRYRIYLLNIHLTTMIWLLGLSIISAKSFSNPEQLQLSLNSTQLRQLHRFHATLYKPTFYNTATINIAKLKPSKVKIISIHFQSFNLSSNPSPIFHLNHIYDYTSYVPRPHQSECRFGWQYCGSINIY